MPATLEDPANAPMFRTSGQMPYPSPGSPPPLSIMPRQVVLRDRNTIATLIPFTSPAQVPLTLLSYLSNQFAREVEKGDTYPITEPVSSEDFGPYWFGIFGVIMLLGHVTGIEDVHIMAQNGDDWEKTCLGSFYIKPNYPGRSSHVCNGGFLVTDGARNRGVGRLMGETYLEWAPKLGYTYSMFNLVYETNVASCRLWDALGFKRIGRVKGAGRLQSYPDEMIDAIIYGRDLGQDEDMVSEERFDKIRFYLKNGKYPNGADRAEKSRLRSAATHYKLVEAKGEKPEMLMLKGKEVVSDPQRQYEVARQIHHRSHGGINKTTASIAESYHWVRIKETVSQVIRNCPECSEMSKTAFGSNKVPLPSPAAPQYMPNMTAQPAPLRPADHERAQNPLKEPSSLSLPTNTESHLGVGMDQEQKFSALAHFSAFDMPLDPALMATQHSSSLNNLPAPQFLPDGCDPHMPHLPDIDTRISDLASQMDVDQNHGLTMNGHEIQDQLSTGREEIRRRLTRAGYSQQQST